LPDFVFIRDKLWWNRAAVILTFCFALILCFARVSRGAICARPPSVSADASSDGAAS
jgi:hypothetical protein